MDWLEANLCVDYAKVYAIGFSNGATFTYAVSAALSTRITAFVANSGTPHPGYEAAPTVAQSAMDIHGSNDRVHQFFGREDDFYRGVAGARKRESDSEVRGVDPRARCYELA